MIFRCVPGIPGMPFIMLFLMMLTGCQGEQQNEKQGVAPVHLSEQHTLNTLAPVQDSVRLDSLITQANAIRYLFPDSALLLLQQATEACRERNYDAGLVQALMVKALTLVEKGRYQEAIDAMTKAQVFISSKKQAVTWHVNLAVIYSYTDEYQKQLTHYTEALKILDSLGNKDDILYIPAYLNISNIWSLIGDTDKRKYYLEKAVTIASRKSDKDDNGIFKLDALASLYNTQAVDLIDDGQFDEAMIYLKKSLSISDTLPLLIKRRKNSYLLLSLAHVHKGEYNKALQYVTLYSAKDDKGSPPSATAEPDKILAEIYFRKQDYERAFFFANRATETNRKLQSGNTAKEIRTAEIKAESLARLGRNNESVKEYQQLVQLIDSNLNTEKLRTNRKMDFMYQAGVKDKELAEQRLLLSKKNEQLKSQKIMISLAAASLLICLLLLYVFRSRQKLQQKVFRLQSKENELTYLKEITAMEEQQRRKIGAELHDGISGTMAAIKMNLSTVKKRYAELNASELFTETQDMLREATEEIRTTAHNLIPEILLKNGLNEAIITYTNRIRNNTALEIEYNYFVQEPLLRDEVNLTLFRIIQELLQNIQNHSYARKTTIQLLEAKGKLSLIVEDDGIGFNPEQAFSGIGLNNIKIRARSLDGDIDIQSQPGRHTVIRIAFEKIKLT